MFTITDLDQSIITQQASAIITVDTYQQSFIDITDIIQTWITEKSFKSGLLTVFCKHTSASLTIQENADPDVLTDLSTALDSLAPRNAQYQHSYEGQDDMPAHIRTMLTSSCLSIPISDGKPVLGTWQGIYLIEHRDRTHRRQVIIKYIGT